MFVLLLLSVLTLSCSDNITDTIDPAKAEKISKLIDKICDSLTTKIKDPDYPDWNLNVPGVIAGIWSDQNNFNYVKCSGYSDLAAKTPMTEHLLFRVGSNTKTFVITVLLQLVDEKKISLDDKLDKFYPEFPRSNEVTIRQLCNMTSGIFNFWESQNFIDWIVSNPHKVGTPWEFISWALPNPYPYGFNIGKGLHYSNTNTYLIGLIIEKITGNRVEQEVKTRIIDKLQLTHTFFPATYTFPSGFAYSKGYYATSDLKGPKDFSEFLDPSLTWAAGAIISNADDMRIWVKVCAEGSMLSKEIQAERLKTIPFPEINSQYGLGITEYRGFYGHGGDIYGYHTIFLYSPVKKTTVAVMLNKQANQHLTAQKIIDLYLTL